MLPQLGDGLLLLYGMFAAIVLIVATSAIVMRSAGWPRWLAWLGIVAAVILLFGVVFIPMIALPVWVIATSSVFLREPELAPRAMPAG